MNDAELTEAVERLVARVEPAGKRIVVLVPDATRSVPLARVAGRLDAAIGGRAAEVVWLVALGTHQPMSAPALARHVGPVDGDVRNHEWWRPDRLVSVGTIPAGEVRELSGGRIADAIDVRLNRAVVEADAVIICGPVFPHEVVGFSGGNKYLFPGVAGREIIDSTHWLGAILTSSALIGTLGANPVRAVIDRAAALVPTDRWCLALVVAAGGGLHACFSGRPEEAWAAAAERSAQVHIRRVPHPVRTVLSVMPERYEDLWTAAKGVYKVDPVVADGGEIIVHAPHVTAVSVTHGDLIAEVGYHVRDYFTGQWDRFGHYPGSVLAHSTHVSGDGTWSAIDGERRRVTVTLATGIDAATCRAHNLGYLDPAGIDVAAWTARAETDPDLLVVPDAGEELFRLAGP